MEMWELVAREQIRDTLARYNWSGDAGRLEGLAETFCVDGVLEIRGAVDVHVTYAFAMPKHRNAAVLRDKIDQGF